MANLAGKVINNTDWEKVEDLMGITLDVGTIYVLQSRNPSYVCAKSTKPTKDEGYLINENTNSLITYKQLEDGATLWIKTTPLTAVFNIGT